MICTAMKLFFTSTFFYYKVSAGNFICKGDYTMSKDLNATVKKIISQLNKIKDLYFKYMDITAHVLYKHGVSANVVSVVGFAAGIFAINFLSITYYGSALICILINRFLDGVDGVIARKEDVTDFGVFLDAALDYAFYAGIIFGFALANPSSNAIAASFWLFGFAVSACAMLAYAVVSYKNYCEKRGEKKKLPMYLGGFFQGFEMLAGIVLLCLIPGWFVPAAVVLGCLALVKALTVVSVAYYNLVIFQKKK